MHPGRRNLLVVLLASLVVSPAIKAQTATGGIRGTISDPSRAVIPGAVITVTSKATGISRHVVSDDTGSYFMPNLNPGEYEVKVQLPSFQGQAQDVTILTGATANADFDLRVGTATEIVQVTGNTAQVNLVEYKIDGVVTREQIENLPLNGRSFLQLAMLEPAVAVESVSNPGSFGNNFFRVSMAGAAYGQTRISVDGGSVNDRSTGGAAQNFSQESVQEFQISTFNFDLATSVTAVGSVNVVSRTGGNSFHGSTFFFFRDHNLAAYPGLKRDSQNADPFFARRQSGFTLGGPLKKDRFFWFTNLEHNNQLSVFTVAHTDRVFFPFDHIGESPFRGNLFNVRFDYAVSIKHTAFLRYSLDKNKNFSPSPQGGMESFWLSSRNFANQTVLGVISVLTPRVVNDFRYNWGIYHNNLNAPSAAECTHPVGCLGVGGPRITVSGTGFVVGHHENVPQYRMNRTYQLTDTLSWQKGDHRVRFGGEWEHFVHDGNWARQSAGVITLFGPETVRVQNPTLYNSLPATLRGTTAGTPALADILRLPLNNISVGVGDGSSPAPYSREQARRNDRYRLFIQDTWRAHPRLTLNYGLAWSTEDNLRNYDLTKPEYLRPILGGPAANLNPPPHEYLLFAPALGLVWSLDKRNKTVFRAGSGIYYDSDFGAYRITERRVIGPAGNGLVLIPGSAVSNPFSGQPGQPPTLLFSVPTSANGQDVVGLLPGIKASMLSRMGSGQDLSVRNIEVFKTGNEIWDHDIRTLYSINVTAGVQREVARNMLLSADFVMRRSVAYGGPHGAYEVDNNRFLRPKVTSVDPATGVVSFVRDPVIPLCTAAQQNDPKAQCSVGAIGVYRSAANYRYTGLLMKLEKRFSARYLFTASYAFSRFTGWNGIVNLDNLNESYGVTGSDRPHRFTFSGVWELPQYGGQRQWPRKLLNGWQVSAIHQMVSSPPMNVTINNVDIDGDGTSVLVLPELKFNGFGRSSDVAHVRKLVDRYNATYPTAVTGKRTPQNQVVPVVKLPDSFSNGDSFLSTDLRLTRNIRILERARLSLMIEAFNLLNIANLSGHSGALNALAGPGQVQSLTFGQPTVRTAQVFGTGGPRAFQLGARLSW